MAMLLRAIDLDGVRRGLALSGPPSGITLDAAAEFACALASEASGGPLSRLYKQSLKRVDLLNEMVGWLATAKRPAIAPLASAPLQDMWAIETRDDVSSLQWIEFQDRFRRAAARCGFSSDLGAALSLALGEMGDNVFRHSGGARGLVAYHIRDRAMTWCAVDIGRGVLTSLRGSDRWKDLPNAESALLAVWRDHATSRPDSVAGTGFRQVDRSIAAMNGVLRFRTDDAALGLTGSSGAFRGSQRTSPRLCGLQVSVSCSIGKPFAAEPLSD
jgi:hypothetical protein